MPLIIDDLVNYLRRTDLHKKYNLNSANICDLDMLHNLESNMPIKNLRNIIYEYLPLSIENLLDLEGTMICFKFPLQKGEWDVEASWMVYMDLANNSKQKFQTFYSAFEAIFEYCKWEEKIYYYFFGELEKSIYSYCKCTFPPNQSYYASRNIEVIILKANGKYRLIIYHGVREITFETNNIYCFKDIINDACKNKRKLIL